MATLPLILIPVASLLFGSSGAWANPGSSAVVSTDKTLSVPVVVAKVRSSVVTILTRGVPASPSQVQSGSGSGSGVIIDEGGYILTNNHLVTGVKSMVGGKMESHMLRFRATADGINRQMLKEYERVDSPSRYTVRVKSLL